MSFVAPLRSNAQQQREETLCVFRPSLCTAVGRILVVWMPLRHHDGGYLAHLTGEEHPTCCCCCYTWPRLTGGIQYTLCVIYPVFIFFIGFFRALGLIGSLLFVLLVHAFPAFHPAHTLWLDGAARRGCTQSCPHQHHPLLASKRRCRMI